MQICQILHHLLGSNQSRRFFQRNFVKILGLLRFKSEASGGPVGEEVDCGARRAAPSRDAEDGSGQRLRPNRRRSWIFFCIDRFFCAPLFQLLQAARYVKSTMTLAILRISYDDPYFVDLLK